MAPTRSPTLPPRPSNVFQVGCDATCANNTAYQVGGGPAGISPFLPDPVIFMARGVTYALNQSAGSAYPMAIHSTSGDTSVADRYTNGIIGVSPASNSQFLFSVPSDAPDQLFYQSETQSAMGSTIEIGDATMDSLQAGYVLQGAGAVSCLVNFTTLPTPTLTYNIRWDRLTDDASSVAFHGPAVAGSVGPEIVSGLSPVSPSSGSVAIAGSVGNILTDGSAYVNVGTVNFPQGELRGQVRCSFIGTVAPTTAPTTAAPTNAPTQAPTTLAPTTVAPTTLAPTTLAPTLVAGIPTTLAPTTLSPTTVAPTTVQTLAPTTARPTMAPTVAPTAAPTVAPDNVYAAGCGQDGTCDASTNYFMRGGIFGATERADPTLYMARGTGYTITQNAGPNHPMALHRSPNVLSSSDRYVVGVTPTGPVTSGDLNINVADDAPDRIWYRCEFHSQMVGTIEIGDAILEGAQATPTAVPTISGGAVSCAVDFTGAQPTLVWNVRWDPLSGPVTGLHFHGPAPAGVDGGVLVDIGSITGLNTPSTLSTAQVIDTMTALTLTNGNAYVNVHTTQYPNGEIRGQVTCKSIGVVPTTVFVPTARTTTGSRGITTVPGNNTFTGTTVPGGGGLSGGAIAGIVIGVLLLLAIIAIILILLYRNGSLSSHNTKMAIPLDDPYE